MTGPEQDGAASTGVDADRQGALTSWVSGQPLLPSAESVAGLVDVLQAVGAVAVTGTAVERLAALQAVRALLEEARTLVGEAVVWTVVEAKQDGSSWSVIGSAAGVSRQAAQQRWGSFVPTVPTAPAPDEEPGDGEEVAMDKATGQRRHQAARPWLEEVTFRVPGLPLPALRVQVTHRPLPPPGR